MNKKIISLVLVMTLMPSTAIAATPKPTQAQIDAAKKVEAEKKAAADAAANEAEEVEEEEEDTDAFLEEVDKEAFTPYDYQEDDEDRGTNVKKSQACPL